MSKLNIHNKDSWWFVSDHHMMLAHSPWFEAHMIGYGAGDSIERTYEAYVTYRWSGFIKAIESCWKKTENGYKPQRYPVPYLGMHGMSRDHVIYSILAFDASAEDNIMLPSKMQEYIDGCPFIIGDNLGTIMTPKLWFWMQLMAGRNRGVPYYVIALFDAIKNVAWNKFLNLFSGINYGKEVNQHQFVPVFSNQKTKLTNMLIKMYYPTYALKLAAHMIGAVKQNVFTRLTKKILMRICPEDNILIKALLVGADNLSLTDLEKAAYYESMTCDRWSGQLNPIYNDRPIYVVGKRFGDHYIVENDFDRDYLLAVCNIKGAN